MPDQDETPFFERLRAPAPGHSFLQRFSAPLLTLLLALLCGLLETLFIISNPVPREIAFMQRYIQTRSADAALPIQESSTAPVDRFLAECPSASALDALDSDLAITFEFDQAGTPLACQDAAGSRDLTLFEKRFYNTVLLMKELRFNQPLPWSGKALYAWFVGAIDGIRVREDIAVSYCCDPGDIINIRAASLAINKTGRWLDPEIDDGVISLLLLLVHESRHAEGYLHDCAGSSDSRIAKLGAWGVQYMLDAWLAKYTDPAYFAASDVDYREFLRKDAESIVRAYICQKPTPKVMP